MTSLAAALLVLVVAPQPQDPPAETAATPVEAAAESLQRLVDMPTAKERRKEAAALARNEDVPLEAWLEAAASFAPLPSPPELARPGRHRLEVDLVVDGETVPTRLHLWVPSAPADGPRPLILAHHGAGGNGAGMVEQWRGVAEELGALVCAPDDMGPNQGYRFTAEERASALAALRWMRRHFDVDENRIHLTGQSRGGHLVWDLAVRHPDLWASVTPMIGGPTFVVSEGRNSLRYVENLTDVPLLQLQGAGDDPKLLLNLRLAFERLEAAGAADAKLVLQEGLLHGYDFTAVDWVDYLGSRVRDPFPRRIRIREARKQSPRRWWAQVRRLDGSVKETFPIRVEPDRWNRLDHEGKVRFVMELADERTADATLRLEEGPDGPTVVVEGDGVKEFRLLFPAAFAADHPRLGWRGGGRRKGTLRLRPSARTLLEDFAERFDRTFLPVAAVTLKP